MRKTMTVLAVLRMREGLTQTELGDIVGLYQGEVSKAEGGRPVRNLNLIALHFGVNDPADLLLDALSDEGRDVLDIVERVNSKQLAGVA